jgi:hypothetical protein
MQAKSMIDTPTRSANASRLTWATIATAQHEQKGHRKAGEDGEKCKAYKVGHNRIIF